jgi:hypothetical protein
MATAGTLRDQSACSAGRVFDRLTGISSYNVEEYDEGVLHKILALGVIIRPSMETTCMSSPNCSVTPWGKDPDQ